MTSRRNRADAVRLYVEFSFTRGSGVRDVRGAGCQGCVMSGVRDVTTDKFVFLLLVHKSKLEEQQGHKVVQMMSPKFQPYFCNFQSNNPPSPSPEFDCFKTQFPVGIKLFVSLYVTPLPSFFIYFSIGSKKFKKIKTIYQVKILNNSF